MKSLSAFAVMASLSLTTFLIAGHDRAFAGTSRTPAEETSRTSVSSSVSENKAAAQKPKKIRWANGTITKWDDASKTFILKEESGGKKKTSSEVTYSWDDKTVV